MTYGTESQEQINLFTWANYQLHEYPELKLMYHIPNGGKRNLTTGVRLKREGVKAGVPDIFLPVANGGFHGLYIELKVKNNGTTDKQDIWLDALTKQGYLAIVCYGWVEASVKITQYLKMNKTHERE